MLKMIGLVQAASEVIQGPFLETEGFFEAVVLREVHKMDIQLCCFLAGIYVCVHLFGCQNKSHVFRNSSLQMFYMHIRGK